MAKATQVKRFARWIWSAWEVYGVFKALPAWMVGGGVDAVISFAVSIPLWAKILLGVSLGLMWLLLVPKLLAWLFGRPDKPHTAPAGVETSGLEKPVFQATDLHAESKTGMILQQVQVGGNLTLNPATPEAKLSAVPGSPTAPILAESQLFFSNLMCHDFAHGGQGNFGGLDSSKKYAYVSSIANAQSEMAITKIALIIDDLEYPAVGWRTLEVGGSGNYLCAFKIEITPTTGLGKHEAKIVAFANGKSWQSPCFDIDIPSFQ